MRDHIAWSNFLIWFQIYYNIFIKYLIMDLGAPSYLNYVTDVVTLLLFICLLCRFHITYKVSRPFVSILILMFLFVISGLTSSIMNGASFLLFLWSFRCLCRFFIWFFCVALLLKTDSIDKHFKIMERLAILNLCLMIYQYFALGLRNDYLNGFFGSYTGGNSALNTFMVILTIETIAYYLAGKKSRKALCFNLFLTCATCALNEIKYYYVELVVIAVIISYLQLSKKKKTIRKAAVLVTFILVAAIAGYQTLSYFYPGFRNFFQKEIFIDYLTRSYNSYKLIYHNGIPVANRLTAYPIIWKYFLTDISHILFGIGMGAADTSAFFTSSFYLLYGPIAYQGFLFSHVFLENGMLGLIVLFLIFIAIFFFSHRQISGSYKKELTYLSGTAAILGVLMCFYNSALRIESSGYLFFTVLAFSFAAGREWNEHLSY